MESELAKRLDLPLRHGLPGWVGVVTAFMVGLPVMMINGTYTGSIQEVSGTLGALTEDITMGYYSASAGMAIVYPIINKVTSRVTQKTMLLTSLCLQTVISWLCAKTRSTDLLIVYSFVLGFVKGFVMLWFVRMLSKLVSPHNVRSEFYAYFYPIVFSVGQLSMIVTAQLAYYYDWKYMYYFEIILLLAAIVMVLATFRYAKVPTASPFKGIDFRSIFIVGVAVLMIMYVFTYGKTLDWFHSPRLRYYLVASILLMFLFLWVQWTNRSREPYIYLVQITRVKPLLGYLYMFITMFFCSSGTLITSYVTSIVGTDSVHANTLYLYVIPGFVVGAFLCFWWFRWQRWRFRYFVSAGMFCFVGYFGIMYFGIAPGSTYEMLHLPMFLRGVGMMILFISFGLFVVEELPMKYMLSNAFFLIFSRSVLAPVIGSSFFNNMLYYLQLRGNQRLSETITMSDPVAAGQFTSSLQNAMAQGHSYMESVQVATSSIYSTLQQQSLLLSMKTILGYMLIAALVLAIASAFIPFHKTVKVKIIRTGDDMV